MKDSVDFTPITTRRGERKACIDIWFGHEEPLDGICLEIEVEFERNLFLDRSGAAELWPILKKFAETGEL